MKHYLPFAGAIAGLIALLAVPAQAQTRCGPHNDIVGKLDTQFEERQSAAGLANSGDLLEVFTSKGGSWTILITRPDGTSCLVATGDTWMESPEPTKTAGQEL